MLHVDPTTLPEHYRAVRARLNTLRWRQCYVRPIGPRKPHNLIYAVPIGPVWMLYQAPIGPQRPPKRDILRLATRGWSRNKDAAQALLDEVCSGHGVPRISILARNRSLEVVAARDELIWRLSTELGWSSVAIGSFVGGRDHSSILAALKRYEKGLRS